MPRQPNKSKVSPKNGEMELKPIVLKKYVKLTLVKAPGAVTGTVDAEVLECIGRQSGGKTITLHATLGALGVNGVPLAGCLNQKFGPKFKGSDFPAKMEVVQCILFVRTKVP